MSRHVYIAPPNTNQATRWLVFFLACALLAVGPIVRGGNRQVALVALVAIAAMLIASLVALASFNAFRERRLPPFSGWWISLVLLVGASPFWVGLLHLTPIPVALFSAMAGREIYPPALAAAGAMVTATLPLSLQPSATWAAILSGLPTAAVFFAGLFLHRQMAARAIGVLLLMGAGQMLLGVLQVVAGPSSQWYFGLVGSGGVVGSFANRNHLACFLAMMIPLWFYYANSGCSNFQGRRDDASRSPDTGFSISFQLPLWLFFGFCILVLLLSTLSRGGILAGAVVLAVSVAVFVLGLGERINARQRIGIATLVTLFAIVTAGAVGLDPLNRRLESDTVLTDASVRGDYVIATLNGARTFWPWGSGVGTFESVFPRFQPLRTLGYVEYAHNDYAQLLMELGAAGVAILLATLVLVVAQARRLMEGANSPGLRDAWTLRCYCGIAASALLMHSIVEFNMHIPALATTAAFLMGVFLRPLSVENHSKPAQVRAA